MSEEAKKKEKKPLTAAEKKKRRRIVRLVVVLVIVALIAAYFIFSWMKMKDYVPTVATETAQTGDIEQIVSLSGSVASGEEKSYFADVSAPIASRPVSVGDTVNAGDTLVTFDTSDLTLSKQQAQLKAQAATGDYNNSMQKDAEGTADLNEANARLPELEAQIDTVQAQIDALNIKIDEKKRRMAATGAELQKALLDLTPDTDDYREVQRSIQDNTYAQTNDQELASWNNEITQLNHQLEDLKEEKSKMDAQKTSGESAQLNAGAKSSLAANQQETALTSQDTVSSVDAAAQGVTADFNGVVTEVKVQEGETPAKGAELLHLASTENVKVQIQITKADLERIKVGQAADITVAGNEYKGTVSKIAGAAVKNQNNVPVVDGEIAIENPDNNIILGVEAKVKIHTQKANGVVILPYEYINSDTQGDFVYVVENGVVERRDVETGITTDTQAEIKSGVNAGDQIVSTLPAGVEVGMTVQAVNAADAALTGGAEVPAADDAVGETAPAEDGAGENAAPAENGAPAAGEENGADAAPEASSGASGEPSEIVALDAAPEAAS